MDFIRIIKSIHFKNPVYGDGLLAEGKTYYTYSQFAGETAKQRVGYIIEHDKPGIVHFQPFHLGLKKPPNKTLLLFAGGMGDTITLGIVMPQVMKKYGISFDICCEKVRWHAILKPMGMPGKYIPLFPDLETLSHYDAVLTDITMIYGLKGGLKVSPVVELCHGFGVNLEGVKTTYKIPSRTREEFKLPQTNAVRIGVNFDSNGGLKSYPERLQEPLLTGLRGLGFEIYILGVKGYKQGGYDVNGIYDFRGKTTIPELAALIEQMDAVLGVDSFITHLSNLLKVSSLVLLSTTAPSYFEWHKQITCLTSPLKCSPCFEVFDICPLGYEECHAFYHERIGPDIISDYFVNNFPTRLNPTGDSRSRALLGHSLAPLP